MSHPTIPMGVRVKPSRKGRVYRAYFDEFRADLVETMNQERRASNAGIFTSHELEAIALIETIRKFSKKSRDHYEYAQLILELWDV
jgi:hypothetical protein